MLGTRAGDGLAREGGFVDERSLADHDAIDGHDFAGCDDEQVAAPDVADIGRHEASVFVAVDRWRGAPDEGGELAAGAGAGVAFERAAAREHEGDDGAGEVLLQHERARHGQERDEVDTEATAENTSERVDGEGTESGHRGGSPGGRSESRRAGEGGGGTREEAAHGGRQHDARDEVRPRGHARV